VLEKTQKNLLPFASCLKSENASCLQSENGSLGREVEKAAIFCLTELGREPGGGVFRKKPSENIVFISEVYYPFWIAPFRGATLLFDGLNTSAHTLTYPSVPVLQVFKDNLNQRSSTRQIYSAFLFNNLNYFQDSNDEQEKVIVGLISDIDVIKEFMDYSKEATTTENPVTDSVLISAAYDEKQIMNNIQELEVSRSRVAKELEELNEIIKLLNAKTQQALDALREEIKATDEKFSEPIEAAKATFEKKKLELNKEYTDKVTTSSTMYEQETVALQKEILKLEKTRDELNSEIEHIETEIKNAVINKDEASEQRWKEKRNELKKKLPEIAPAIRDLEIKIQEIEENKKKAIFQLKQENDAKMKDAGKDLSEIESSRDAEKRNCKDEMEKIEELTSNMISKIDKLSRMREATLKEFDAFGIPNGRAIPKLVYMPFYLQCYQTKSDKRFNYVAPSIVSSMSLNAKLKAIGKKRISQLFQPRSQKVISILNRFMVLLGENIAFSHEINEACNKVNMLQSKETIELMKTGLNELKTEGWLSDSEFEAFRQILT
jgi:DNA repair exonuclease SbcCD ATPase subunit